jgi:hypothetical protein
VELKPLNNGLQIFAAVPAAPTATDDDAFSAALDAATTATTAATTATTAATTAASTTTPAAAATTPAASTTTPAAATTTSSVAGAADYAAANPNSPYSFTQPDPYGPVVQMVTCPASTGGAMTTIPVSKATAEQLSWANAQAPEDSRLAAGQSVASLAPIGPTSYSIVGWRTDPTSGGLAPIYGPAPTTSDS